MADTLTARQLGERSRAAVGAKDREGWLDLFADDAVVEDPIGPSPFDPEGHGHRGKAAIAAFYDNVIAGSERIEFQIDESYHVRPRGRGGRHDPYDAGRRPARGRGAVHLHVLRRRRRSAGRAPFVLGVRRHGAHRGRRLVGPDLGQSGATRTILPSFPPPANRS